MIGFLLFVVILVAIVWGAARATRKDRNLKQSGNGWSYGLGYRTPGERDQLGLKRKKRRRR